MLNSKAGASGAAAAGSSSSRSARVLRAAAATEAPPVASTSSAKAGPIIMNGQVLHSLTPKRLELVNGMSDYVEKQVYPLLKPPSRSPRDQRKKDTLFRMPATTISKAQMAAGLLAAVVLAAVLGAAAAQPSSSMAAGMSAATTTTMAAAPAPATTPAPAMAAPAKDDTLVQKETKPMAPAMTAMTAMAAMAAMAPAPAMPAGSAEAAAPNHSKKPPKPPPSSLPLPGALATAATTGGGDEQSMSMGADSMAATTMPTKTTTPTKPMPAKKAAAAAAAPQVSCPDLPPPPRGTRRFALTAAPVLRGTNPRLARTQSLAYNGTAVGPLIRVKKGDLVQVDVTNDGIKEGTSVHWHGLDLPNAAWADGVAAVSQRPIPDGSTFSYRFVAEPAGTFWYHSHTGGQYADGLRGPLIVDAAGDDDEEGDPHLSLYDHDLDEHVLMLADVFQTTSEEQLAELQRGGMGGSAEMQGVGAAESMMGVPSTPEAPSGKMAALCDPAVLNQDISDAPWYGVQVNGQGVIAAADDVQGKNGTTTKTTGAPLVLTVERGQRYRLRLIGGMSSWALKVNFTGGHQFDVIALDGRPIEPKKARALILTSGERADVVLKADRPIGNYWIDFSTLDGKNSPAILHYKGAPDPLGPKGEAFMRTMRLKLPEGCASALGGQAGLIDPKNATGLVAAAAGSGVVSPPPAGPADKSYTIYLADASSSVPPPSFLKHIKTNGSNIHGFSLRDGNVPTKGPSCPPLEEGKNETSKYCWSLNWNVYEPPVDGVPLIFGSPDPSKPAPRTYNIDVEQGQVVDLVLLNPSLMVHPMHLHGTGFWVLGTGNGLIVDGNDRLVPSKAKLNLRNPPVRDTVPVAQAAPARPAAGEDGETELSPSSYGYAVVRFKADNPGPWAFHCHIELHASAGMFLTFTVHPSGENKKALASASSSSSASPPWVVPKNLDCDAGYAARALREEEQELTEPPPAPAASSSSPLARRAGVAIAALAASAALAP